MVRPSVIIASSTMPWLVSGNSSPGRLAVTTTLSGSVSPFWVNSSRKSSGLPTQTSTRLLITSTAALTGTLICRAAAMAVSWSAISRSRVYFTETTSTSPAHRITSYNVCYTKLLRHSWLAHWGCSSWCSGRSLTETTCPSCHSSTVRLARIIKPRLSVRHTSSGKVV